MAKLLNYIAKKKFFVSVVLWVIIACLTGVGFALMFSSDSRRSALADLSGTGDKDDPIIISNADEFNLLASNVNLGDSYEGVYFALGGDIDFEGKAVTCMGNSAAKCFKGNFDGKGFTLKRLNIVYSTASANPFAGVFGYTQNATIKDLNVEGVYVYALGNNGGNGGTGGTGATPSNKNTGGTGGTGGTGVTGVAANVGGLIGYASNTTIENCNVTGFVRAQGGTGGNGGTGGRGGQTSSVSTGYAKGGVGGTGGTGGAGGVARAGGLVGYGEDVQITDCSFVGAVYAVGGNGGNGGAGGTGGHGSTTSTSSTYTQYNAGGAGGKGGQAGTGGAVSAGGLVGNLKKSSGTSSLSGSYSNAYVMAQAGFGGSGGTGGMGGTARNNSTNYSPKYGAGGAGGNAGSRGNSNAGGAVGYTMGTVSNCFVGGTVEVDASRSGYGGNPGVNGNNTSNGGLGGNLSDHNFSYVGGAIGKIGGVAKINGIVSNAEVSVVHALSNQNNYTNMIGGIAGFTDATTAFVDVVCLAKSFGGQANATNYVSPIANYTSDEYKAAGVVASENVVYYKDYKALNSTEGYNAFTLNTENTVKPFTDKDALTNKGVFSWLSGDWNLEWQFRRKINNDLPVPVGVSKINNIAKTYEVSTKADFLKAANEISTAYSGIICAEINIKADIDLGDWKPIGTGFYNTAVNIVINGNDHTLSGMNVAATAAYNGLVGYAHKFECRNLTIKDPNIEGVDASGNRFAYVGALVGCSRWSTYIENCHVTLSPTVDAQACVVAGSSYVGGLAGYVRGRNTKSAVINSSSCITVSQTNNVAGGLVGQVDGVKVESSYATGDVVLAAPNTTVTPSTNTYYSYTGGLIGFIEYGSTVKNCFATGSITGANALGFVGAVSYNGGYTLLEGNYYSGIMRSTYTGTNLVAMGGMLGHCWAKNVTFKNNVVAVPSMTVSSTGTQKFVGKLYAFPAITSYRSYHGINNFTVYYYQYADAIRNTYTSTNNYYRGDLIQTASVGTGSYNYLYFINKDTEIASKDYSDIKARDFWQDTIEIDTDVWKWSESVNGGLPTLINNPFNVSAMEIEIKTADDLVAFSKAVNKGFTFAGKTFVLTADIDLSKVNWMPAGNNATFSFRGTFDGRGHVISNMTVLSSYALANRGLFGYTLNATVKNLTLKNPIIQSSALAQNGALIGYADGTEIIGCNVIDPSVATSSGNNVGGLIGYCNNASTIVGCNVTGGYVSSVSGSNVGGLVGAINANSKVENCSVVGAEGKDATKISGGTCVGGIVGYFAATAAYDTSNAVVAQCVSGASVNGTGSYVGGVAGQIRGVTVSKCYSLGSVNGKFDGIGGLVGANSTYASIIANCYSGGDVTANSLAGGNNNVSAGGVLGVALIATTVTNCIVTGNVKAFSTNNANYLAAAGGIIGRCNVVATMGNCAVLSEQIMATKNSNNSVTSLMANGVGMNGTTASAITPVALAESNNFYNKDVLRSGNRNLAAATYSDKITAAEKPLDDFKKSDTYAALAWDMEGIWAISADVNNGLPYLVALGAPKYPLGSKNNPYLINNAEEFKQFSENVNNGEAYAGKYILQTEDIDMTGIATTGKTQPFAFRGTYDGGQHKLKNVNIVSSTNYTGIFGYAYNATFKNIAVLLPKVTTSAHYAGTILGYMWGNCYVENCAAIGGSVKGSATSNGIGGLIGYIANAGNVYNDYVSKSFSSADVSGGYNVGGLVGLVAYANFTKCYSAGNVVGTCVNNYGTGGLIGNGSYIYVSDCYSKSNVSDSSMSTHSVAGGIVGVAGNNTIVTYSYFNGELSAAMNSANNINYGAFAGGILGFCISNTSQVDRCVSAIISINAVAAKGNYVQGSYLSCSNSSTTNRAVIPTFNYYLAVTMPTAKGTDYGQYSTEDNKMRATTIDNVKNKNIFGGLYLKWDITTNNNTLKTWDLKPDSNGGFPFLCGLMTDVAELAKLVEEAKVEKAEDWSAASFGVLSSAISDAEKAIEGNPSRDEVDTLVLALNNALAELEADTTQLRELYNLVMEKYADHSVLFSNWTVTAKALVTAGRILNAGSKTYRNSEVIAAYNALDTAVKNLKLDKSELNNYIQEANLKNEVCYLVADWNVLQDAVKTAIAVNNKADATFEEILEALEKLREALDNLKLDKTNLTNLIISVYGNLGAQAAVNEEKTDFVVTNEENMLKPEQFVSYTKFGEALEAAINVWKRNDVEVSDMESAIAELNYRMNSLVLDKTALQDEYGKALLVNKRPYTAESIAALDIAITDAGTLLAKSSTKESLRTDATAIAAAINGLKTAIEGLAIDKANLNALIEEAEKINEEDFASSGNGTWQDFQAALQNARSVSTNANATYEQVKAAEESLQNAMKSLKLSFVYLKAYRAEAAELVSKDYYTQESRATLQSAIDTADGLISQEATLGQDELDSVKNATAALQAAITAVKADKSMLQGYVNRVNDKYDSSYIDPNKYDAADIENLESWAVEAQALLSDSAATDDRVISAILTFRTLFASLRPNKEELSTLVNECSRLSNSKYRQDNDGNWELDESGNLKIFVVYREDSWNAFQAKLTEATKMLNSNVIEADGAARPITYGDVEKACSELREAKEKLVVDTSELELRIAKATELLKDTALYTKKTVDKLKNELSNARYLIEDFEAGEPTSLEDVQNTLDDLNEAINGLRVDKTSLEIKLTEAKDLQTYSRYYTESSYRNLKTQIEFADGIIEDDTALTSADVTMLFNLINDAIAKLVISTVDLDAIMAKVKALDSRFVTEDTYKAVTDKLAEIEEQLKEPLKVDNIENLDKWVKDLQELFDAVSPNVDNFKAFIAEAEALTKLAYTASSLEILTPVIATAKTLSTGANPTYDDIIAAVKDIEAAKAELVVDKTTLQALIDSTRNDMQKVLEYDAEKMAYEYYTVASYKALEDALNTASALALNSRATLEEVENAKTAINEARSKLVVDKSLLQDEINICDSIEGNAYFDADSYSALLAKLEKAKEDVANEALTLAELYASYNELNAARVALKFKTDALDGILEIAQSKSEENYSEASYGNLTKLIVKAQEFKLTHESAESIEQSIQEYNALCWQLYEAILDLVDLTVPRKLLENENAYIEENTALYNQTLWDAYRAAVDALKEVIEKPDASKKELDAATLTITEAKGKLIDLTDYQKLLDESKAFIGESAEKYTAETWSVYLAAVQELEDAIKNSEISQEGLVTATQAVSAAEENLVEDLYVHDDKKDQAKDDLGDDKDFVEKNKDKYPDVNWDEYEKALKDLEDLLQKEELTKKELEEALKALEEAKDKLKGDVLPDDEKKDEAQNTLGDEKKFVEDNKDKYPKEDLDEYQNKLKELEELLTKQNIEKAELDRLLKELEEAKTNLSNKELADDEAKGNAQNTLGDEKKFVEENKDEYDKEALDEYENKLKEFEELLQKEQITKAELEAALKALEKAKDKLVNGTSSVFTVIESNTTFKFVYGDNSVVNFAEHVYDAEKPIYLTNLALGDSISDVIAQFDSADVKVFDAKGVEITDLTKVIATGMVLKIMADEQVLDELTLVIKGDINGDGDISGLDKAQLNNYMLGRSNLTGANWLACDLNGDGDISGLDKAQLNNYMLGRNNIFNGLSVKGAE